MATPGFISGAYSATFNSVDVGRTEIGIELVIRPSYNVIRCDETGRTPVDGIWTGVEDMIIRMETQEWSATSWQAVAEWIYASTTHGSITKAGTLLSTLAHSLVLAPLTGPAVASGKTWTIQKAVCLEPHRLPLSAQRLRTDTLGFFVLANSITSQVASLYTVA